MPPTRAPSHAAPPKELAERLSRPGPKRVLALDGGGIRGLISLGYLRVLEDTLRARSGRPDLVLADYFDLVGGTSTGSIIATAISLGWTVDQLHGLYMDLARDVFKPRRSVMGPLTRLVGAKFDERPLEEALRREVGDGRLDSDRLRTGLVVVAKRADTASAWHLTNIPTNRFYPMNRHLRLWEILRASSAAPTYFAPQRIDNLGDGERGVFVDGGVSMHVNPALQMLMVATLKGFGLEWPTGADRLLLCSVGTGSFDLKPPPGALSGVRQMQALGMLMIQLMREASDLGELILQWLSESPTARSMDLQVGDLAGETLGGSPALHYLRYNVELTLDGLADIDFACTEPELAEIRDMAEVRHVDRLDRLGRKAGSIVKPDHLPAAFDPPSFADGPEGGA